MTNKLATVFAAAVATVALAACGGYDPTDAVNSFNDTINSEIQSSLSTAGLTGAEAADAGVDLKCPNDVQKEEAFTCTVTGKLSGKSADVQMEVNSSDELAPVNESAFQGQLDTISESEGVAVGKAAAN